MGSSKYKYSDFSTKFKNRLKSNLSVNNDDVANGFNLEHIPKENDLKKASKCLVKISYMAKEVKNLKKMYVKSSDNLALADYLKTSDNPNDITKVINLIDSLKKYFDELEKVCRQSGNQRSMVFGFLFYTTEKNVKKICDNFFGKGNESSLNILVNDLKENLKERKKALGRPEYSEGGTNIGVQTVYDSDEINYNEGGNFQNNK